MKQLALTIFYFIIAKIQETTIFLLKTVGCITGIIVGISLLIFGIIVPIETYGEIESFASCVTPLERYNCITGGVISYIIVGIIVVIVLGLLLVIGDSLIKWLKDNWRKAKRKAINRCR